MDSIKSYPTMYKRSKRGKIQQWSVELDPNHEMKGEVFPCIIRKSGQQDGKISTKKTMVKKGTNVGKANEKTPVEQAMFKIDCMITDKVEENYVLDLADVDLPPTYYYPMLAQKVKKDKDYTKTKYAQPKLNGVRMWQPRHMSPSLLNIRDITPLTCLSRKMWPMPVINHIKQELDMFKQYSPDGEVYRHGVPLQTINKWATKDYGLEKSGSLEYWVYDLVIPDMPFIERSELIKDLVPPDHPFIKIVPTIPCNSKMEFVQLHDKWVLKGFEGAMERDGEEGYEINERSYNLGKFKNFDDEEFNVVGYETEDYHDAKSDEIWQLVVWVCETEEGRQFTCRPTGSMFKRRIDLFDPNKGINSLYKVRYQEKSVDNIPLMLTGRGFRDKKIW